MRSPAVPAWLRQLAVVVVGCALAAVMVLLGLWQLQVFREQGQAASAARAAEPAVDLASVARPGDPVLDGYGRTVAFSCRYLPETQLRVPLTGSPTVDRVLTGCRLDGGGVVAVARGTVGSGATVSDPPGGAVVGTGLLLPSEDAADSSVSGGRLSSVRIPVLAQDWPGPLVDGYIVLAPADAQAQGLDPVPVVLPEARGRLRNGAYALQWWVFAAFAIAMAGHIARDIGRRGGVVEEPVVQPGR